MMVGVHGDGLAMFAVLALAGVASAVVLALALAALFRRRSRAYLLVALALSTLLARTAVAALSATGRVGPELHHVLEHGLDVTMAGLVIAAVYDARAVRRAARDSTPNESPRASNESPLESNEPARASNDSTGGEKP